MRPVNSVICSLLVCGLVSALISPVLGDTFTAEYGSSTLDQIEVALGSVHTFEVNTPAFITKNTEWYLTYSGGSPVETDSGISNPQYTKSFPSPGTQWIRAEVYDSGWNWEEAHRWEVTVAESKPDLRGTILLSSGPWMPGTSLAGDVRVFNDPSSAEAASQSGVADLFLSYGAPSYDTSNRIERLNYNPLQVGQAVYLPFFYAFSSSAATGTYYLTCAVDATDTSDETNEGNNTDQEMVIVIGSNSLPDLICTDIAVDATIVGQPSIVTASLRNQGGQSAEMFEYSIFIDSQLSSTGTVAELAGLQTTNVSCVFTATNAGTRMVEVIVDTVSNVVESVEDNNSRQESFLWEVGQADLVAHGWTAYPSPVNAGETVTAQLDVFNDGNIDAAPGQVWFFWHKGSPSYSIGDRIDTAFYGAIPPTADSTEAGHYTVPSDAEPGTYFISYFVDATDSTDESNEGNNTGSRPITVLQPDKPDLVVSSIAVSPSYAWQPSTITTVIFNSGSVAAQFGVFDRILQIDVNGQQESDLTFGGLTIPAHDTYISIENMTITNLGTFDVQVVVDPDNDVDESDEGNNNLTVTNEWIVSPTADSDDDGMKDVDELVAGTDPGNTENVLSCSVSQTGDVCVLSWPSVSNRFYGVDAAQDLLIGFSTIASNIPANPPQNTFSNEVGSAIFYRITVRE